MARFTVNSYRFDPYRNFKFKVKWDNQYVAGSAQVQRLAEDHGNDRVARSR